ALGVPLTVRSMPQPASRFRVAAGRSLTTVPELDTRAFDFEAYRPWSTHDAYATALVTGNDGVLSVSDITRATDDAEGHAHDLVVEIPRVFARKLKAPKLK